MPNLRIIVRNNSKTSTLTNYNYKINPQNFIYRHDVYNIKINNIIYGLWRTGCLILCKIKYY